MYVGARDMGYRLAGMAVDGPMVGGQGPDHGGARRNLLRPDGTGLPRTAVSWWRWWERRLQPLLDVNAVEVGGDKDIVPVEVIITRRLEIDVEEVEVPGFEKSPLRRVAVSKHRISNDPILLSSDFDPVILISGYGVALYQRASYVRGKRTGREPDAVARNGDRLACCIPTKGDTDLTPLAVVSHNIAHDASGDVGNIRDARVVVFA